MKTLLPVIRKHYFSLTRMDADRRPRRGLKGVFKHRVEDPHGKLQYPQGNR